MSTPMRNGMIATMTACPRLLAIITERRSYLSTKTPAMSPTTRLGTAVAISVTPTRNADWVCW